MDDSTKEALIVTGCTLTLLPVLYRWMSSYTELHYKYGWRINNVYPEFRFVTSTLLFGGLMYRIFKK